MSSVIEIKIPDIGDFADVEVIELLVAPGDRITAEDPLLTLESDKATMEVPSPVSGTVREMTVAVGDRVSEGSPVAMLDTGDGEPAAPGEQPPTAESVTGGEAGGQTEDSSAEVPETEPAARPEPSGPAPQGPPRTLPPPVQKSGSAVPHASPGIRRFARELGADLTQIGGSGPKGRILKEDIKLWIKQKLAGIAAGGTEAAGSGIPEIPAVDFAKFGAVETVSLGRIKKISGQHLRRAWLNVPHVTHQDEADITELEEFRQSLKEEAAREGIRITLLGFVLKILVSALKKFPSFNASIHPNGENLVLKKYFHIGVAVDTPNGLMVPVIRDVDRKSIFDLARDLGEMSEKARNGKLSPTDMQGGCISISSLGGIGGTAFTPIVNAPEVAILGLSRARMTPVWNGKEFEPRLMLPLSLSYDHRVIDGAEAARFCAYLARALADMRRISL